MRVFATLHSGAQTVRRIENLVHETLGHGLFATCLGVAGEPTQGESVGTVRLDLNGHLVGGTTHATRTNLKGGAHVVERLLERGYGVPAGLGLYALEGTVNDALGEALLAIKKNLVDELGDDGCAVYGIGNNGTLGSWSFTRHYFFSIFAP